MHFAVPFTLTSPILGVRRALVVGLVALIPDVDALLYIHRSITHSLIFILAIAIPIVAVIILLKPKLASLAIASILSVLSHLILDFTQTYTPILYPLIQSSINLDIKGGVIIGSSINPYIKINVDMKPIDFTPFTSLDAPLFTSNGLALSIMLISIPILYTYKHKLTLKTSRLKNIYTASKR